MGTLGGGEILLILVLALLLFGPRSLPKIGKTIGRGLAEFRKASNELRSNLEREVEMEEFQQIKDDVKSIHRDLADPLSRSEQGHDAGPTPPGIESPVTPASDVDEKPQS